MQWSLDKRPHKLADLYGCEAIKTYFKASALQKKWPAAIMLQGQYGTGKTTAAMIAAQMMVCQNPDEEGNPCCECSSCQAIMNNKFNRDVVMYDGGQMGKDDIIESVSEFIKFPPKYDSKRIVIMEEAQELSQKARNAMLKILEQDRPNVHFIFTSMGNIPKSGFVSRCVPFNFAKATVKDLMIFMAKTLESEGLWDDTKLPADFLNNGLASIARSSDGSYRNAIQTLQLCVQSNVFSAEEIAKEFGILDSESYVQVLCDILEGKATETMLNTLVSSDYQASFRMSYSLLALADEYRTFGETTGKDFLETQAKKLAVYPKFDIVLDAFKKLSSMNKGGYLEKSDYIVTICELVRQCKTSVDLNKPALAEPAKVVRRIKETS